MRTLIIAMIIIWIASAVVEYGLFFGSVQGKWPSIAKENRLHDRMFALLFALFGPVALFATVFANSMAGIKSVIRFR